MWPLCVGDFVSPRSRCHCHIGRLKRTQCDAQHKSKHISSADWQWCWGYTNLFTVKSRRYGLLCWWECTGEWISHTLTAAAHDNCFCVFKLIVVVVHIFTRLEEFVSRLGGRAALCDERIRICWLTKGKMFNVIRRIYHIHIAWTGWSNNATSICVIVGWIFWATDGIRPIEWNCAGTKSTPNERNEGERRQSDFSIAASFSMKMRSIRIQMRGNR